MLWIVSLEVARIHDHAVHDRRNAEPNETPVVPGVAAPARLHPSIHLPRSVYSPSRQVGFSGLRRVFLRAKNSSFASNTAPTETSAATSTRSGEETHGSNGKQSTPRADPRTAGKLHSPRRYVASTTPAIFGEATGYPNGDDGDRSRSPRTPPPGGQSTRSASLPGAIAPLRDGDRRPATVPC